jgi:hypothetical protein
VSRREVLPTRCDPIGTILISWYDVIVDVHQHKQLSLELRGKEMQKANLNNEENGLLGAYSRLLSST